MIPNQSRIRSERGVALVIVLMLSTVVAALTMTLTLSGQTHVAISHNHEMAARARTAAEAGLNHGLEVTSSYLRAWQTNGFASTSAAMTRMLLGPDNASGTVANDADNGSLETWGIPRPPARINFVATDGTSYEVRVFDEDDPARGLTLIAADRIRIGEDANTVLDANSRIIVRAIGYAPSDTRVMLEAHLSPVALPAIVSNGSLDISGNPAVSGTHGSVHANINLSIGGSPSIAKDATASQIFTTAGSATIGGDSGGGRPTVQVPPVNPLDHKAIADFILLSNGTMTNQAGVVLCVGAACKLIYGWEPDGATGWKLAGTTLAPGTYYVEGNASMSGNPGSAAAPIACSIIATGSIDIAGNPDLKPDAPEIMFVAGGDLKITGGLTLPFNVEGMFLVHEQLFIAGNPDLNGQIIVENAPSVSNLVAVNSISGNPTITYNGLVGSGGVLNVTGWREMR